MHCQPHFDRRLPDFVAAFSVPVLGEARTASLFAGAGRSALGRGAVRGGVGAAQGAAGTLALQPLDAMAYSLDGRDYTFADALKGIASNAGLGGVLHVGFGGAADVWRGVKARPLYPFAAGEPYARQPGAPPSLLPTDTGVTPPPPPPAPLAPGEFPEIAARAVPPAAPPPVPERIPPGPAMWANEHFSFPIEVADEAPSEGTDGRLYQRVRHEGRETYVPLDEITPTPGAAATPTPELAAGEPPTARQAPEPPQDAAALRDEWRRLGRDFNEREVLIHDSQALDELRQETGETLDALRTRLVAENVAAKARLAELDEALERAGGSAAVEAGRQETRSPRGATLPAPDEIHPPRATEGAAPQRVQPVTPADATIPPQDRARPAPGPLPNTVVTFAPGDLHVDAKRFQFKSGGDEQGVTDRLRGVTHWDPILAQTVLVWQDRQGRNWIVDGHQRLALATRIAAEHPEQNPQLLAFVFREAWGTTDRAARTVAALRNIAEGTGTAIDAAKVLRDEPRLVHLLPPRSELVRQARGLANLSNDAFLMVVDEAVPANYAAIVGRLVPQDADLQRALLHLLEKTDPANVVQAEAIVRRGIENAAAHRGQADLLSIESEIAKALYSERAKVLDLALKDLKRDKVVFNILSRERERIEEVGGNTLAIDINERRLAADATAIQVLQFLAARAGPVSDALDAAAERIRAGDKPADAVREFVAALRLLAERGDLAGLADGAQRRAAHAGTENGAGAVEPAPERGASRVAGRRTAAEIRDVTTPPVNPATGTNEVLPPLEAQEVLKGAIANLIQGRPVRAGEQIDATRARAAGVTPIQAWQRLATELLRHEESAAIAASRAAEAMPEPESASPEPSVRARAAAELGDEAAEQFKNAKDFLTDDEAREDHAAFEAAIQEHADEQRRKAEMIRQGIGCLMAGGFAKGAEDT